MERHVKYYNHSTSGGRRSDGNNSLGKFLLMIFLKRNLQNFLSKIFDSPQGSYRGCAEKKPDRAEMFKGEASTSFHTDRPAIQDAVLSSGSSSLYNLGAGDTPEPRAWLL